MSPLRLMSNQRVVVLTDEQIEHVIGALEVRGAGQTGCEECRKIASGLRMVLEHPGGITEEQAAAGARTQWEHKTAHNGPLCRWDLLPARERREGIERFCGGLEAAFFSGDEPTGVGSSADNPSKQAKELGHTVGQVPK
jgi:hypothetical protein